jgi:GDP/UDP-N,N'-diacetylbacillosamine 2-epimerase (hydrolysing)
MLKRKIGVVTGTRAEYGLLRPLLSELIKNNSIDLYIIATGMHLCPQFGNTYREIEKDGFFIWQKLDLLLADDSTVAVTKSIGLGVIGFADCFEKLKPDMLVLLGDRFELLAAATAATVARIPIAHIHGGETTQGAIDEAIRHSISKMSFLHFTSTEVYRRRVIQLGEDPKRVHNVGALGIDNFIGLDLMEKSILEESLGFKLGDKCLLVTYHPVTLEGPDATELQFSNLLIALSELREYRVIFTMANSDPSGQIINSMIDDAVQKEPERYISFKSMGQVRYLSAMKQVNAMIGNSSSGIIETPTVGLPTVNIGERQRGRVQAANIINSDYDVESLRTAIAMALSDQFRLKAKHAVNPHGIGGAAKRISEIIAGQIEIDLKKVFFDLD